MVEEVASGIEAADLPEEQRKQRRTSDENHQLLDSGQMRHRMHPPARAVPTGTIVVVAALDEATAIGPVVEALRQSGATVVVVDDGSTDETARAATDAGAIALRHLVNLGQGAALVTGMRYALARLQPSVLVTFDADGQHDAADLAALTRPILSGDADVVLGTRFANGGQAVGMPRLRRQLLRLAARSGSRAHGLTLTDSHNGLRALAPGAATMLTDRLSQMRMAHASEIVALVAHGGCRVVEVPVTVRYTPYSLAKGQRLRHALVVLWDLLASRLLRS
jgi:glycosyltransferase involved in cell wall biosynthesis